jgi:hypothetical protein
VKLVKEKKHKLKSDESVQNISLVVLDLFMSKVDNIFGLINKLAHLLIEMQILEVSVFPPHFLQNMFSLVTPSQRKQTLFPEFELV